MTLGGVLMIAFTATQVLLPHTATIPGRLVKNKDVMVAVWMFVCLISSNFVLSK
jgi:hypothetical protein